MSVLRRALGPLRRREPYWRRIETFVPAPRDVVDPGRAGVDEAALQMPKAFARLSAPPVFICGSARSGTTWTFDLFERHPQVRAVCESWILSQTQGVTSILSQPYWDLAVKQGWEAKVDMPFGAVQLLPYDRMVGDVRDLLARWLTHDVGPEHRYLAAKEPLDIRSASILFPEARFIHVIRDGRSVALSMKRASETWDPTMGVGLPMAVRAEAWRRQLDNVRRHGKALGGRYMEIRYEAMRREPKAAMRTIFDFAGIDHDDELLEQIARETQLGSYDERVRNSGFRGGGERRGWRVDFSLRDALGFQRAAGDLLIELGYEHDASWWWKSKVPFGRNGAGSRNGRSA